MQIKLKRVYEEASADDGWRVLVDRIWPRGLTKEKAALNDWCKDIAPSTELRKWFNHEVEKWPEFIKKYHDELDQEHADVLAFMDSIKDHQTVSFLYAAHDDDHNNAVILKSYIKKLGC